MILAFDTAYLEMKAKTVCFAFEHWIDEKPSVVYTEITTVKSGYEPGHFYKRELPCIMSLLNQIDTSTTEAIVVDGFVVLDDDGRLGLGGHLYENLQRHIPVIGVAKTNFAQNTRLKIRLTRGTSQRPLYITALGMTLDQAAEHIISMHGAFRLPTLLQQLDRQTKT